MLQSDLCFHPLVALYPSAHFTGMRGDRATGEIGGVIRIEQLPIILLGIALWQKEWLGDLAIGIEGSKVDMSV